MLFIRKLNKKIKMKKISKKHKENMEKGKLEAQPKLAVKITDTVEVWVDERNYILKNNGGKILGYYHSFVPLIWSLFDTEVKLYLGQEVELKDVVKKIDEAEKYIRSLAKKLEELPRLY